MKNNTTMQKGRGLFAPAEFDSAISHFLEHENSGLMLINVPTGVGKTYQTKKYIFNHFKEKTFFYVTPLNKNVKDAYQGTKQFFVEAGLENEFEKRAIILQSNLDMFEEHIDEVKNHLDERITSLSSFKKLIRKPKSDKLDADEKEEKALIESKFRVELRNLLFEVFKTRKPNELIMGINGSETFKPLLTLYPSIKSCEKNIFFLSVDKLYVGNTPIVETHYDFMRSKLMDGAVVFLDEFDSTKEKLLGKMISEAAEGAIDLPQLFRYINDKIRGNAPSINKEMLVDLPDKAENRTSKYAFECTQNIFKERVQKYNLDRKFKYNGTVNSQYFILSDWSSPVVAELGKKDTPTLYVSYDDESQSNLISDKEGNMKLASVFRPLSGAIEFFVNALKLISGNEYEYRRQNRIGEVLTIYDCVDSVLDNFDFEPHEANWNYISPLINNKLRSKEDNVKKNKFDIDFYSSGFDYISISNNIQTAHSSKIDCISLHSTPEDYLVHLAQKAHVIGLSATAEFETVTGNYDLIYVRRKLGSLAYSIPNDDQGKINDYITERLGENKSVPITKEASADSNDVYGLDGVFQDYDDAKHFSCELERIEAQHKSDDENGDSIENNCKRFSKIFQTIVDFASNQEGKVLLVLSNRNVGNGTHNIDTYKDFCKKAGKDITSIEFIALASKTWDEDVTRYEDAVKTKKVVLFTSYQAASTGQNLQFVEKLEQFEKEKDIDSIYLEYPTHQIVKNGDKLSNQQKIEAVYQVEALSEYGMFSKKMRKPLIKAYLSGCRINYQNDLYRCRSTNMHILKTLCQAIGRVSRTTEKEGNAYIYIDEDIVKKVDVSLLLNGIYTKEFAAFLKYVHETKRNNQSVSDEDSERLNIAESLNEKAVQMINDFIGDWGEFDSHEMEAWTKLREFVISNPTISLEQLRMNPDYQRYYLQSPTSGGICNYYYSGTNDWVDCISYVQTNDIYYQVNDENACLQYLNKNPIITKEFVSKRVPIKWGANDYIILPTIYRNIYRGAIGEHCVKVLLEHRGLILSEITDPKRFERFDYVLDGRESVGVDAKFWSLSSATATSEDLLKEVEVEKILRKMKESSFEKAVIVNILCKNASASLRKPHIEGDGKILIIPSLINPDSLDASIDEEALNAINEFLEDGNNGK